MYRLVSQPFVLAERVETTVDVLTDVLETLRARGACYARVTAGEPWGLALPGGDIAVFHLILDGSCLLRLEGHDDVELFGGDLVAVPHGAPHELVSGETSRALDLAEAIGKQKRPGPVSLEIGGRGERAMFVSGKIEFEDPVGNPLLAALPRVVLLRGGASALVEWLDPTLRFIASEAASTRPGAQTVVSRLADVLFVQIVRAHLATVLPEAGGWLGALADPQIGAALGLIHENPGRNWTVQSLATTAGMSRSAFAVRFNRLVGEPPLHYLTRWRMQKAQRLLRDGRASLSSVASSVGYDSEAAFSKAFKRAVGAAPGTYRRQARRAGLGVAA
jgi:AraC-like DNA-binding protein